MDNLVELQKIIFKYFKDVDNDTFIDIVDSFVFDIPNPSSKASKLIEKFLKDNGLNEAFINYHYDKKNVKYFRRSSLSQLSMIEDVKSSLLTASYNRFRVSVSEVALKKANLRVEETNHKLTKINLKIEKEKHNISNLNSKLINVNSNTNRKNFNFLKKNLLKCYSALNNNESYFNGEVEDSKFVAKVGEMTFKNK